MIVTEKAFWYFYYLMVNLTINDHLSKGNFVLVTILILHIFLIHHRYLTTMMSSSSRWTLAPSVTRSMHFLISIRHKCWMISNSFSITVRSITTATASSFVLALSLQRRLKNGWKSLAYLMMAHQHPVGNQGEVDHLCDVAMLLDLIICLN